MTLAVQDLGRIDYATAHALQQARVLARRRDEIPDTLLLAEHPTVVTLGRGTDRANLLDPDRFPVVEIERGGDVTVHAPGQLVGYLIRKLLPGARDLHAHLRLLEGILIEALAGFGLEARRVPGKTGVWIEARKIASLGIACRDWCTWHGFALNLDVDLEVFTAVNPCGFQAACMTSMARELGATPGRDEVARAVAAATERALAGTR